MLSVIAMLFIFCVSPVLAASAIQYGTSTGSNRECKGLNPADNCVGCPSWNIDHRIQFFRWVKRFESGHHYRICAVK